MKRWTRLILLLALLTALGLLAIGTASANSSAVWPTPGKNIKKNGKLEIDMSHTSDGYFMAGVSKKNKKRLKLRVVKGGQTLTYDLVGDTSFEVFPLQLGSGKYEVSLYENVSGKKYAQAGQLALQVSLNSEDAAFYYPNQYVSYTKLSESVKQAEALAAGLGDLEKFSVMCDYITKNFLYDYVKAVTIKAGQLPDIDGSWNKKMGVCQDLSAILCSMLRTQGLPARLIIGYADKQYHAWTVTTINGKDYFFDPTAAIGGISKVIDYSVERYY